MTAKMNMKSWYTMRMLKTFFRDVTTQSKTACGEDRRGAKVSENDKTRYQIWARRVGVCSTLSLGSLLMVLRGRRTLRTLRDLIVLMSRPLLFLSTLNCSDQSDCCTCKVIHRTDITHLKQWEIIKNIHKYIYMKKNMNSTEPIRCHEGRQDSIFVILKKT